MLLNPFPNKPLVLHVCSTSLNKSCNEQFLLFPQCFLSFWKTFCCFNKFQNHRLLTISVWKSLKSVIWERVKVKNESYSDKRGLMHLKNKPKFSGLRIVSLLQVLVVKYLHNFIKITRIYCIFKSWNWSCILFS